jgi:hypothetical protein
VDFRFEGSKCEDERDEVGERRKTFCIRMSMYSKSDA